MLEAIAQAMREVIGGVDAPAVSCPVMGRVLDPVSNRVLLAVLHNMLHPQGGAAFFQLPFSHILQNEYKRVCEKSINIFGSAHMFGTQLIGNRTRAWGPKQPDKRHGDVAGDIRNKLC